MQLLTMLVGCLLLALAAFIALPFWIALLVSVGVALICCSIFAMFVKTNENIVLAAKSVIGIIRERTK